MGAWYFLNARKAELLGGAPPACARVAPREREPGDGEQGRARPRAEDAPRRGVRGLSELLERWGVRGASAPRSCWSRRSSTASRRPSAHRIRRALVLYVLFVLLAGAAQILAHLRAPAMATWAEYAALFAGVFAAFTCVELACLVVFDVFLPAVGVVLVTITSDIVVGVAYIFAVFGVLKAAGVSASSVVTTSAVVSGVLALSLQTTLGNILGGVALQLDGSDPRRRLGAARRRQPGEGRHDPLAPHGRRDAQLGHDHRPEREPPRAEHHHPRQAHGQAGAAPHVGLLQRRLPLRPVARHRRGPHGPRAWRRSRAWPTTPSPASSATTSRRTAATASRTTPCATG